MGFGSPMLLGVPCRGVGCRGWTPSTPKTRIGVGSEAGVQTYLLCLTVALTYLLCLTQDRNRGLQ